MIHATNPEGTIAAFEHTPGEYPYICGHEIPRDRDSCACGSRRAVIAVEYQPLLEPAHS